MYKKRGYTRDTQQNLVRDYKLFAISCEGGRREPEYFRTFEYLSKKIKVDIIEDKVPSDELNTTIESKSSPRWVLERAIKYIEQEGLTDEDDLWFVMDVDRWKKKQLFEIYNYCKDHPNWHILLSNPCFEVWLYFHQSANISNSNSSSCNQFKSEIASFKKGGYCPLVFLGNLKEAILNAKQNDNKKNYFFPEVKNSKLYELGEALLNIISVQDLNEFLEIKLPTLLEAKKKTVRNAKKKTSVKKGITKASVKKRVKRR